MRRILLVFLSLLVVISFSSVRVLVVYESDYDDESIIKLPLAKKDAENFSSVISKIPRAQVEILSNPTYGDLIRRLKGRETSRIR